MYESVFCLEPPGFGNERKGIIDALHLGCIPVLFMPRRMDSWHYQLQWGAFRRDSRVLIDGEAVAAGEVDVLEVLAAIPAARVARMQRTIAAWARRLPLS